MMRGQTSIESQYDIMRRMKELKKAVFFEYTHFVTLALVIFAYYMLNISKLYDQIAEKKKNEQNHHANFCFE